jgi:hypothetical protein
MRKIIFAFLTMTFPLLADSQRCKLPTLSSYATMARPRKKARTTKQADADANEGKDNDDVRVRSEGVMEKLSETLDALESSSDPVVMGASGLLTDASCSFLKLKSLQRMVLDKLKETHGALEKQRQRRDEQELQLENLKYRKTMNEYSIQACQTVENSHLVKLCRDELDPPTNMTPESSLTEQTIESTVIEFLGADPNDPEQRATIVAKLNTQVKTRHALEKELKQSQHKAASLKQSLATKKKLLQELPLKLHEMERASLPLQKFCQKSFRNSKKQAGSQRRTCLDLAQSLPKHLYTLYYQLQSCLDTMEVNTAAAAAAGEATTEASPSIEIDNDSTTVVLKIPIPTVSDTTSPSSSTKLRTTKKAAAIVQFSYNKRWDLVAAHSSADHDMGNLIGELFPGDTGVWVSSTTEDDEQASSPRGEGRPYGWCNYLAGLHLPDPSASKSRQHISTRVVVHALIRRVRATATLHWLLHSLSRKLIPIHPAMKQTLLASSSSGENHSVKISNWTEQPSSSDDLGGPSQNNNCRIFAVTLKRKSATLVVRARVNVERYPSLPPTWEFETSNNQEALEDLETNQETPLYDDRLAGLERRVNQNVEELVVATDDTTYDWILSHQLAEIAKGWEELQSTSASKKNNS